MKVKYHVIFYLSFSLTLGKVFYSEDASLFFKSGKLSSVNYSFPLFPLGFLFVCLFGTSMRWMLEFLELLTFFITSLCTEAELANAL